MPHAPAAWENKKVLISLSNKEGQKDQVLEIGKTLKNLGFTLVGTQGTADFYNANASFVNFDFNIEHKTR